MKKYLSALFVLLAVCVHAQYGRLAIYTSVYLDTDSFRITVFKTNENKLLLEEKLSWNVPKVIDSLQAGDYFVRLFPMKNMTWCLPNVLKFSLFKLPRSILI